MLKTISFKHSLKFKIVFVTFLIIIMLIGLLLYKFHKDQEDMIKMQEDNLNQIAVDTIQRRFKVSYQILEVGVTQILENSSIIESFAERDREELLNLVKNPFNELKEVGVTQFHFYLADNKSFLRVHEPNLFGDNLEFRKTISTINKDPNHKAIKGIEEGIQGLCLRYIHPIYYNEEYIGSIELAMELEDRILNIFNNVSGGEWYLYSIKENQNFLMKGTTDEDAYPINFNEKHLDDLKKGEIIERYDSPYIIQMIPITDFEGNHSYYLKRVFNNSELIELSNKYTFNSLIYSLIIALLGMLMLWLVVNYLLKPLSYLEDKTRRFMAGTLDESIKVDTKSEIGYLADTMEKMRLALLKREKKLKELSFKDSLTKLYNRHYLEHIFKAFDENKSYPISIVIADLDGLKEINDKKGHLEGDEHIKLCSEVMKNALRKTDYLFRIGGDEFAFLMPKTNKDDAKKVLSRIRKEVTKYNKSIKDIETPISISLGIATCNNNCESLEKVMNLADKRMYINKKRKRVAR